MTLMTPKPKPENEPSTGQQEPFPYAMCASAMLQIVFQILVEKLEVSLPAIHPVLISIDARTS